MPGIGILATDTLYGLVASALDRAGVEKIYELKKRQLDKPLIVLISSREQLANFDINVDAKLSAELDKYWPGPVSIALPLPNNPNIRHRWEYLHRGTNSIAFRLPNKQELLDFLKSHGPLVAPSANPEGLPPAQTIAEAKNYFGNNLDFYIGGAKRLTGPASTLLYWDGEKMRQIR
jgi:L-threonylcarbamoyladenylate synthase